MKKSFTVADHMLSFNFNKKKQTGMKQIPVDDRMLVEAVAQGYFPVYRKEFAVSERKATGYE